MACSHVLCPNMKVSQHISYCKFCNKKGECDSYKKGVEHQEQYKDYLTVLNNNGSYSIIGKLA